MIGQLALSLLSERDSERALQEVRDLKRRHPRSSDAEMSGKLVRRAAARCALAAATASAPAGLASGLPAAADFTYQMKVFHGLILQLAELDRRPLTPLERAAALAGSFSVAAVAEGVRRRAVRGIRGSLSGSSPLVAALSSAAIGAAAGFGVALAVGALSREAVRRRSGHRAFFS